MSCEVHMTDGPLCGPTTVRIFEGEDEWDAVQRDWDELNAASPAASTPRDFTCLRSWWRVYQPALRAERLQVVTVWRGAQLVAVVPLYISRGRVGPLGVRRLGFISTGEAEFEETCPDYLDMLYLPGAEATCADSV